MVMISLRDYYREIESLIESAQNDEAIFHCMVILQSYPKSIETYRNMGKALLDSKRYSEAAEVFSKILTVFPDDFITHVGLSVIKEEERDLDAAIWHMEQAFELQPSNLALQEELRRLFGRRDGVPPTKIRLTRGALVKMYARGELHQQAIAEIKSVLKDEPSRVDYQALLAKMFMVSGAHTDAVEIASTIVENYPYCYEANRILDELLAGTEKPEGGSIYRERLVDLDPYYQFVDALTPNAADVSAEMVMLEKKIYSSSPEGRSDVSDWAKQINFNWKERDVFIESEPIDLLNQVEAFNGKATEPIINQPVNPFIGEVMPELENKETKNENESEPLPDWIVNAGWTRSTEASNVEIEKNASIGSEDDDQQQAVLSQELPDWLKSLGVTDESETSKIEETEFSPILNDDLSDSTLTEIESIDSSEEKLPGWLSSQTQSDTPEELHVEEFAKDTSLIEGDEHATQSDELPDWLKSLTPADEPESIDSFEDTAPEILTGDNEQLTHVEDLPDWLESLSSKDQSTIEVSSEIGESLNSVVESGENEDNHSPISSEEMKEAIDNWVSESSSEEVFEEKVVEDNQSEGQPSDWLNQFINDNDSEKNGQKTENIPDWLKSFGSEDEGLSSGQADQPDWLTSLQDQEQESDEVTFEKGPVEPESVLEPDMIQNIDDILDDIESNQREAENYSNVHNPSEQLPAQESSEEIIESEAVRQNTEESVDKTESSIPLWVKNILDTTPPAISEPFTASETMETVENISPPNEKPSAASSQANDEEVIEPLISDLPDQANHIGAISGSSNDELFSWLQEVNPSDESLLNDTNIPILNDEERFKSKLTEESLVEDLVRDSLPEMDQVEENPELPTDEITEPEFENRLSELLEQPVDENISLEEIEESPILTSDETGIEKSVDQIESELVIDAEESGITIDKIAETSDQSASVPADPLERIQSIVESGDCSSLSSVIGESINTGLSQVKVIETLEILSQKQPDLYELWRELGDLYLAESNFDKALKAYNIAESILKF